MTTLTTWQNDWKLWTRVTYGILHSVQLASRLDFGNPSTLQASIAAASAWSPSALGFVSAADSRRFRAGSIRISDSDVGEILGVLPPSTISLLVIGTTAVAEALLGTLLVQRSVCRSAPANLSSALKTLATHLKDVDPRAYQRDAWAFTAAHELRILRNCIVHASSVWSARACNDLKTATGQSVAPGTTVSLSVDDLFRYRRALRTVLNRAARA